MKKHLNVKNIIIIASLAYIITALVFFKKFIIINFKISMSENLSQDIALWGQTGDFFGGMLNPFFTFLGLIFVLKTINQNQETLNRASFEKNFFYLISLISKVKEELLYVGSEKVEQPKNDGANSTVMVDTSTEYKGNHALIKLSEKLKEKRRKAELDISAVKHLYNNFIENYQGNKLSYYFTVLYKTIKYIHDSTLLKEEKIFYIDSVIIQLSEHELHLYFYHCLVNNNNEILQLIKKYNLLEFFEKNQLIQEDDLKLMKEEIDKIK